jgi:hypothetical protein
MENNPDVGFTFGNAIELDEHGERRFTNGIKCKNGARIFTGTEFVRHSGAGNIVTTPTAIVRAELQKELGGYRPELPHSGDMEMWLRLAAFASVGYIQAPQGVYRRHSSNMSLAYMADGYLPDVEQRKAALDCFYESCGRALPDGRGLRKRAYWALGRAALGLASSAFDQGKTQIAERLRDMALLVCPGVRRSMSWAKFVCRQQFGYEAWLLLQPVVNYVRRTGVRL